MGHGVGDELLVEVAARLAASVRQSDTAARLGGDEFALLIDDAADVPRRWTRSRSGSWRRSPSRSRSARPRCSPPATVGVATSADSGDVGRAAAARGPGPVRGEGGGQAALAALPAGADQRDAAAAGDPGRARGRRQDLRVHPGLPADRDAGQRRDRRVRVADPLAAPALGHDAARPVHLRWRRRPGTSSRWAPGCCGRRCPTWSGGGTPRGRRRSTARRRTSRSTCPPASSAIPGSSTACGRRPAGVPACRPSALLLELTESILFGDNERIRAELDELKEIGVRLAIDDFGTGYSSLSYLLDLPIDVLKIDKTFVTGIASSWRRHALVEGIIRLAADA